MKALVSSASRDVHDLKGVTGLNANRSIAGASMVPNGIPPVVVEMVAEFGPARRPRSAGS